MLGRLAALAAFAATVALPVEPPKLIRVYPLGGQLGTVVKVELLGERLSNFSRLEFDCGQLIWERTLDSQPGKVTGEVRINPQAALGAHRLRILSQDGP